MTYDLIRAETVSGKKCWSAISLTFTDIELII